MTKTLVELAAHLSTQAAKHVAKPAEVVANELVVWTAPSQLLGLIGILTKDASCLFSCLVDICAVDYPGRPERFEVVYNLLSVTLNQRVRVKLAVGEETAVPSLTSIFADSGWYEREVWDMHGVFFSGNPDLRRILTDYGFDGHPLRKDFPLTGHVELRYDEEQKRVVYSPVKLTQEFRYFDFLSPWEGPEKYVLPGDEKAAVKK